MSNGMEDGLMDDEIRDALEMTREELLARAEKGEPARVARSDPRKRASTSGAVTMVFDISSIVIQQGHFEGPAVEMKPPSVTVG
jgi:hypothetical protein